MMKKNTNKEAQIARMIQMADISGTRVHETRNALGTLIDFKRGADKVAYGIIKENHQYFIKKANSQTEPRAEDFAYIGGLENVTEYRYDRLSEADKNRNMLLMTINEALGGKEIVTKSGSKPSLLSEGEKPTFEKGVKPDFGKKDDKEDSDDKEDKKEDSDDKEDKKEDSDDKKEDKDEKEEGEKKEEVDEGIEDDIASAEEKLASAEEKTAAEPDAEVAVEPEVSVDSEVPVEPEVGAEEVPAEEPLDIDAIDVGDPEGGEEVPAIDGAEGGAEEMPVDGAEGPVDGEVPADDSLEGDPETADPEGSQLFQDSEEKRVVDSEIGKLAEKMGNIPEYSEEEVNSAVGRLLDPFKKEFAAMDIEAKKEIANENILKVMPEEGGDTPEDQLQASDIEGQELANTEMAEEKTCQECGFAKFAESRGYNAESMMGCGDDEMASLMNGYAMEKEDGMEDEDLESMAVFHNDKLAECLKEEYANEELTTKLEPFVKKINEVEDTSKKKADTVKGMFWWQIEPQKEKDSALKTLTEDEIAEGMDGKDPAAVTVQPMMEGDEDEDAIDAVVDGSGIEPEAEEVPDAPEAEETPDVEEVPDAPEGGEEDVFDLTKHQEPELNMHAGFETMGGGMPKPDGAEVTTVEITKDAVNVTLSESEAKVRKYIRNRLEEMAGNKKPSLNEDKKTASIKKLDSMIDGQIALFESVVEEGDFGQGVANFAGKMSQRIGGDIRRQRQLKQALPNLVNDEQGINQWIRDIFSGGKVHKSAASYIGRATPEVKLEILNQVANDPQGVGMLQANQMGELVYKPVDHSEQIR